MNKRINLLRNVVNRKLHQWCDSIPLKYRSVVVISMLIAFTGVFITMMIIPGIGNTVEIEHIKMLGIDKISKRDSVSEDKNFLINQGNEW